MKRYLAKDILNVTVAGHNGSGKTSLVEALAFISGKCSHLGDIAAGNTICDFDDEEIKRKLSIAASIVPIEWKKIKMNFIDVPGLFDFEGALCEGMRVTDTALITVSGKSGIEAGTYKAFKTADSRNLTKVFFVNGLCEEDSRFYRVFEALKTEFGPTICPIVVPHITDGKADCYVNMLEFKAYSYQDGKSKEVPIPDMGTRFNGLRTAIYEAVAETSDEMFEKYFSGEAFTPEEIIVGISKGVKSGKIIPVFCGDAKYLYGIEQLLDGLKWLLPRANEKNSEIACTIEGEPIIIESNPDKQASAIVFKTIVDQFIGKLSFIKVISGSILPDTSLFNTRTLKIEKISKILTMSGNKQEETDVISAGDIGAIPKLLDTKTGDTLSSLSQKIILDPIAYPSSTFSMAVIPKDKGDEEKIVLAITRLCEEDPTIKLQTNNETHQLILYGLGEQHLDVITSKLKNKFGLDVTLDVPKVAYRETIRKKVSAQGRHKKQTGGHGQFGEVFIEFEPADTDDLIFEERIVGGAVPKTFFPAVEKGLREAICHGPLANYPMVGVKATLYDGSYHPVDSSEMSFKMAAILAYKNGIKKADPILLEPLGDLIATIPEANTGEFMGEINKRRGHILGIDLNDDGVQTIRAQVPMSQMHDFITFMRRSTQGRGTFSFNFSRYEPVPTNIAGKIIEDLNKN